jgi:hypothetical protein
MTRDDFLEVIPIRPRGASLDLHSDLLRFGDVSSILRPGNNHETMLKTLNTQAFLAEAMSALAVAPCWHSRDKRNQSGYGRALAGRCAR